MPVRRANRHNPRGYYELEAVKESGSFDFELERSGSSGGPWDTAATGTDVYTLTDDFTQADWLAAERPPCGCSST